MKIFRKIFFLALTVLTFSACSKDGCDSNSQKAVFKYLPLAGCGWMIALAGENDNLEVINLSDFDITPEVGKEIWISYHEVSGGSYCQAGDIVEIDCIKER